MDTSVTQLNHSMALIHKLNLCPFQTNRLVSLVFVTYGTCISILAMMCAYLVLVETREGAVSHAHPTRLAHVSVPEDTGARGQLPVVAGLGVTVLGLAQVRTWLTPGARQGEDLTGTVSLS